MLFSNSLPSKLSEHHNVTSFVRVLDALQSYKNEVISESLHVNNPAMLLDKKWLLKSLAEYGVSDLPIGYPIQIMQQYLLNVDTVCRIRGCKKGIELYCSLLSFGEVTINDDDFYSDPRAIFLDSLHSGYLTDTSEGSDFYLISDSEEVNPRVTMSITVRSKYFNGEYPTEAAEIKDYIQRTIHKNVGFGNVGFIFKWESRADFYFHELLNKYFV